MGVDLPANTALLRRYSLYVNPTEMECSVWVLTYRLTLPSFAAVACK